MTVDRQGTDSREGRLPGSAPSVLGPGATADSDENQGPGTSHGIGTWSDSSNAEPSDLVGPDMFGPVPCCEVRNYPQLGKGMSWAALSR